MIAYSQRFGFLKLVDYNQYKIIKFAISIEFYQIFHCSIFRKQSSMMKFLGTTNSKNKIIISLDRPSCVVFNNRIVTTFAVIVPEIQPFDFDAFQINEYHENKIFRYFYEFFTTFEIGITIFKNQILYNCKFKKYNKHIITYAINSYFQKNCVQNFWKHTWKHLIVLKLKYVNQSKILKIHF